MNESSEKLLQYLVSFSCLLGRLAISNQLLSFGAFIDLTMPPKTDPPPSDKTMTAMIEALNNFITTSTHNTTRLLENQDIIMKQLCNTPKMGRSGIWVGECYFIDQ
ncbi:hypothetical protein Tco_0980452 [Tanacetum coccineum]